MVRIIIHIAYITGLVSNDAWHAYDVIGVYKIHLRAGGISYFAEPGILWFAGTLMVESGPYHFTKLAILWLARTVMSEVGAHNRGGDASLANRPIPVRKKICIN